MQHRRVRVKASVTVDVWVDVDVDEEIIRFHGGNQIKAFEAAVERAVNTDVGFSEDSANRVGNVTDVFATGWNEE